MAGVRPYQRNMLVEVGVRLIKLATHFLTNHCYSLRCLTKEDVWDMCEDVWDVGVNMMVKHYCFI